MILDGMVFGMVLISYMLLLLKILNKEDRVKMILGGIDQQGLLGVSRPKTKLK
jgi:hypothetical protein